MPATDAQIIAFIRKFCREKGYSPSIREVCENFGYSSPSTIKGRVDKLRDKGLITYIDRMPRTLRVVTREDRHRGR